MGKRLSGNYLDRLFVNIIPWTLLIAVIFLCSKFGLRTTIITFLLSTSAFWLMDTAIIFFKYKKPGNLWYRDGKLTTGAKHIIETEISKITPITDKRNRWSFKMVEFQLKNGEKFFIIDRPQWLLKDFFTHDSKTVEDLQKIFPELKSVTKERTLI